MICLKTPKKFELEIDDQIFLTPFTVNLIPDERQPAKKEVKGT